MKNLSLEYYERGGYDCMTAAWTIYQEAKVLINVDVSHFGQNLNEEIPITDSRVQEAKRIAEICYEALLKA